MLLTADKGVALDIISKDMYIEKCIALLNEKEVYHDSGDQTKSFYFQMVKQLVDLQKKSIGPKFKDQYIKLHPAGENGPPARFCSLLEIHKANIPFRPKVSVCGTST